MQCDYTYKNKGGYESTSTLAWNGIALIHTYWNLSTKEGLLTKVEFQDRSQSYGPPWPLDAGGGVLAGGTDGGRIELFGYHPGVLQAFSSSKLGGFKFERNSRNFVTSHGSSISPAKHYTYDSRGNLSKVTSNSVILQEALYPASCTDSNFRYCNKPTWLKDAKGQQTDYTYHAASGQVASVTGPAVTIGGTTVRPTTRYQYSQRYAYYKKTSNAIERADTPIWMLTSEFTCRTSNATSSGCEAGSLDKVETRYYYGPQDGSPNNLQLRGKSVTAEGNSSQLSTRVTCYAYDNNGNRIAETMPKGAPALESCP